jgi:hypothetical protein
LLDHHLGAAARKVRRKLTGTRSGTLALLAHVMNFSNIDGRIIPAAGWMRRGRINRDRNPAEIERLPGDRLRVARID